MRQPGIVRRFGCVPARSTSRQHAAAAKPASQRPVAAVPMHQRRSNVRRQDAAMGLWKPRMQTACAGMACAGTARRQQVPNKRWWCAHVAACRAPRRRGRRSGVVVTSRCRCASSVSHRSCWSPIWVNHFCGAAWRRHRFTFQAACGFMPRCVAGGIDCCRLRGQ